MFLGSIVALIAPMKANGEIDKLKFRNLLNWHIEQGTKGFVINGTTGESATLKSQERQDLLKMAIEVSSGRVPVIAGTGTNSTATTIEETQAAYSAGASGCLVVAPYYNRPTQYGIYEHFKAVATACDIPILLYNVPSRTASDIAMDTVVNLAKIENIIGIKEATGDIARAKAIREECGKDFVLLSGDDSTVLAFLQAGGDGVISVAANIAPRMVSELCDLYINREHNFEQQALEVNLKLMPLYEALGLESNPIPAKWALMQLGLIDSGIRLPLTVLSEKFHSKVLAALNHCQLEIEKNSEFLREDRL